jgi:excisionase family DNA binding protein
MMTAEEVAKLLRLSLVTVRNHIRDGKIPSVKVGDRVFVSRDVFRQSIEETEQEVA